MDEAGFQRVIAEGRALQERFPDFGLVAVGGTAAALHCRHRFSFDVDVVTQAMREHYNEIAGALEGWDDWVTNRKNPPVLILGERHGVELGLRQQRRHVPLQTTTAQGLVIPTIKEMLRIKAFLLAERRVARDFIDVAALAERLGQSASLQTLSYLNLLYPSGQPQSAVTRFAEACQVNPVDLAEVDFAAYKGLRPPFTDWHHVAETCRCLGRALIKLELNDSLPADLDAKFFEEPL